MIEIHLQLRLPSLADEPVSDGQRCQTATLDQGLEVPLVGGVCEGPDDPFYGTLKRMLADWRR